MWIWKTDPITRSSGRPSELGAPAAGIGGSCQGPISGSALNMPSEIGVGLAVTGIPIDEVRARSVRSMAWRPLVVTIQVSPW
ncbi:Uncharacterised protein [Mycobacterium tuberculosis]|uniref:Uncharacterized protein n=2 Tax=Mycobacterium tuberculosis TaxID=1773 RepID=A0A655AF02_MYCTX|nr:Uncharacterised protein [Mycobacterium tuberculosis]CKS70289.1 Uncharacterised protein [Mycobacterium tuberculosis]